MPIRIDLTFFENENNNDFFDIYPDTNVNNISYFERLASDSIQERPFIFGKSKLDSGDSLLNQYHGAISYNSEIIIEASFIEPLRAISITYDTRFSKDITTTINGGDIEYRTTNGIQNIVFDTPLESFIEIYAYSNDNTPIAIKRIEAYGSKFCIYQEKISNLVVGEQLSNDIKLPSFGYVGSYGNVEIVDENNKILSMIEKSNYNKITIEIFNTYRINENLIGKFYVNNVSKVENSNRIKFTFKDFDETLLQTIVPEIRIDSTSPNSIYAILSIISGILNKKVVFEDESLKQEVGKIVIKFLLFLDEEKLSSLINYFCVATLTCININDDEIEVFRYA